MTLEKNFDATFATTLALREKQIQQSYRPIIGIHKWFARRPGTLFRSLMLAEFSKSEELASSFWKAHSFAGVIADPFMGGGTPIFEANRLGFAVVGSDINPMAFWTVRQSLESLDLDAFREQAAEVIRDVEKTIGDLYLTTCTRCARPASAKYFLWVKTAECPSCAAPNDLFPGFLVAEAERHPKHVVVCSGCGHLNEHDDVPTKGRPGRCSRCRGAVFVDGTVHRQKVTCRACQNAFAFVGKDRQRPLPHRLFAIEYHCAHCKPEHEGRFFKAPDEADLRHTAAAEERLLASAELPIPDDAIPSGDESDRLHRWGYRFYRQMFSSRQLLGLGTLLKRIGAVEPVAIRHALLTVFSDFLRYQNMLCRYDTYALKCQDIFSVHGFPVGLVQCENNILGIEKVGSGAFRHFVEKYLRAKEYCRQPFETRSEGSRKTIVPIHGEKISARLVRRFPRGPGSKAWLVASSATEVVLPKRSLDGVFTDPPYYDNVQYAELMDFCFAWLRLGLQDELPEFRRKTTRCDGELTGNETLGRGLEHFTGGLSEVFSHFAAALKPGAPFVFTYHHNDPVAYVPLVVAILDAGMNCTATLPAAGEMSASLHISGTGSSVLDSVFVCRPISRRQLSGVQKLLALGVGAECERSLRMDSQQMKAAGLRITEGDLRCLLAGHIARHAINVLLRSWDRRQPIGERIAVARGQVRSITDQLDVGRLIEGVLGEAEPDGRRGNVRAAAV